ncbi:MAG: PQQ-binding-like beta-propeller repeat protein [Acidobacteria bacterium]|nr:PQQ-binding-like beta-propeller repeat protein [Acidobacteriota bacterium]
MAPAVAGDLVIVGSCGGTIYALDADDGEPVWSYDTRLDGAPAQFHGEALIRGAVLYIGSDSLRETFLYAIRITDGATIWKKQFAFGVPSRILDFGESIAFVTGEGVMVSVDPGDGSIRWRHEPESLTPGRQRISATAAGHSVVYHAGDGNLYVVDASSGQIEQQLEVGSAAAADPVVAGGQIYLATEDGRVVRVDGLCGKIVAERQLESRPYGALQSDGERIFMLALGEEGSRLISLDTGLESIVWEQPADEWTTFRPLLRRGTITAGMRGQFCSFSTSVGSVLSCTPIDGRVRSFGVAEDTMFIGTIGGTVLAIESPPDE